MEAKLRRLGATSELLTGAVNRADRRRQAAIDRKAHKKIRKTLQWVSVRGVKE